MDAAMLRAQAAHYFEKAKENSPEGEAARQVAQGYLERARDIEESQRHLLKPEA